MRRYGAVIGAVALVLVVGVGGFASATTNCETFTNHGGQVPAGWTATFYENGQSYGPVVGPGYLAPSTAGEDNRTWDKAIKCRTVTTTTIEEPTTTTTEEETTTTEGGQHDDDFSGRHIDYRRPGHFHEYFIPRGHANFYLVGPATLQPLGPPCHGRHCA